MFKLHTKIDGGTSKLTFISNIIPYLLYITKIFQNTSEYMCLLLKITFPPFLYIHIYSQDASGLHDILVGRVRYDQSLDKGTGIEFFIAGDQLLKGAALNAVQIAELLLEK